MKRRTLITAAAAAALPLLASAQASSTRYRVVIQVSDADPGKWNLALNNARNLAADVGAQNVDIEIVAYGPGIGMLKMDSPVGPRVAEASAAGMRVYACQNTMRGQKLEAADMLAGIAYVPAGVTHILKRQTEGWAYLRP